MYARSSFFYVKFLLIYLSYSVSFFVNAYEIPLTIQGTTATKEKITVTLTRTQLEQLPQTSITTYLPWIQGRAEFTGVKLSTLLQTYRIQPKRLRLTALDDYATSIHWQHIRQYEPIIATRKNHQQLRIRNYGPFWLIFPLDKHPELNQREGLGKMIWQLISIQEY